jgi:hypothetical protein
LRYYVYEPRELVEAEDEERYFELGKTVRSGNAPIAWVEADSEYDAAEEFIRQTHGKVQFRLELEPVGDSEWVAEYTLIVEKELVYGVWAEAQFVVLPKSRATRLARIQDAFAESKTWGEFKQRIPQELYKRILESIKENQVTYETDERDVKLPAANDPFLADNLPENDEGTWFPWPGREMMESLPEEIQSRFGKIEESMCGGAFLEIDPSNGARVIQELERLGYECVEDQLLIENMYGARPQT